MGAEVRAGAAKLSIELRKKRLDDSIRRKEYDLKNRNIKLPFLEPNLHGPGLANREQVLATTIKASSEAIREINELLKLKKERERLG